MTRRTCALLDEAIARETPVCWETPTAAAKMIANALALLLFWDRRDADRVCASADGGFVFYFGTDDRYALWEVYEDGSIVAGMMDRSDPGADAVTWDVERLEAASETLARFDEFLEAAPRRKEGPG